ncbi:DHHA1 domain-containing protein [Halobacillus shinanisalinarum]|uniref:DHHA1 domain-containing protein n=1 Tax=Halobacillus shinanisalinarum TaxID=2932258 RepID=A0ABY4GVG3_9BACI|nr:DHHA1 domain-containing protein [Halobacillus shinanisalinarum]UOQ91964.1 DHHA1 domain-containing protein [Halobacillus shinanisalinarum]
MARKLFYEDPYKMEFESKVIKIDQDERGFYVVLEETAFYPTGGGQPHDKGTLNGFEVIDVEEVKGEVRHYTREKLPAETENVQGSIDHERRIDHMQQHSGQHIISAIFDDQFGIPTTSFHLGTDTVTIDLDTEHLSSDLLDKVERQVNEVIRDNYPVKSKWMSAEEAAEYPLRKPLSVKEDVRLIIIPEIDYNGCGGTHPHSTCEVMAVKFLGWTKNKKQVRLEFVCGYRVLYKLKQKHQILTEMKRLIPRPEQKLVEEVDELIKSSKEKDKKIDELEEQLLQHEARDIISESQGDRVIQCVFKGRPIKTLQSLGKAIIEEASDAYLILISEQENQLQFVLAHGADIDRNMNDIAKQIMSLIEGKGGGKPNFVQGGGKKVIDGDVFADRIKALL